MLLFRLPEVDFIDDKAGKPIGINEAIGLRPIAAFGNSAVISRCCSGRPSARACALGRSFITRTPSANMPMTASRASAGSTLRWVLPP